MKHPIIPYNPKLKDRARQLRQNMTQGEMLLWQRLKRKQMMGYDFDRQRNTISIRSNLTAYVS